MCSSVRRGCPRPARRVHGPGPPPGPKCVPAVPGYGFAAAAALVVARRVTAARESRHPAGRLRAARRRPRRQLREREQLAGPGWRRVRLSRE